MTANNSARESASQTFTVLPPKLQIDPTCGPPGTMVTATGSNFGVDIAAGIYFDDGYINVFEYPDASGSIEITFPIPPSSDGVHTVAVRNSVGNNESRHFTAGAACPEIGEVVRADGDVEVRGPDNVWRNVGPGDHVRQNDVIRTSAGGRAGVLFEDNTEMVLSGGTEVKLDEYIYDPNASPTKGSLFFDLLGGAFSYVSGLIAKDDLLDNRELDTDVGPLGIRGTEFIARYGAGGAGVEVSLIEDKVAITPNRTATTTEFTAPITIVFDGSGIQTSSLSRADYDALKAQLFSSARSSDLTISKTGTPDPVTAGADLTYTMTVTNNGPDAATDATVTDTLPATVTLVSATPSQGSCIGASTITCNLGTLANGASATVVIVVKPTQAGSIGNTATVTAVEEDPDSNNNHADATTQVVANRCDADRDGDIDMTDLRMIRDANGQAAAPGDPRDGNGDGAINVADVRYCQLQKAS